MWVHARVGAIDGRMQCGPLPKETRGRIQSMCELFALAISRGFTADDSRLAALASLCMCRALAQLHLAHSARAPTKLVFPLTVDRTVYKLKRATEQQERAERDHTRHVRALVHGSCDPSPAVLVVRWRVSSERTVRMLKPRVYSAAQFRAARAGWRWPSFVRARAQCTLWRAARSSGKRRRCRRPSSGPKPRASPPLSLSSVF